MYPLTFDHLKLVGKTSVFSNYVFAPSMEQKLQFKKAKELAPIASPLFLSIYFSLSTIGSALASMWIWIQTPLLSQCGSRSRSGSRSNFKVIKIRFLHDNILKVGSRLKNKPTKLPKPFLRQEASFIC